MVSTLAGVIDASTLAAVVFGEAEAAAINLDLAPEQLVSTTLLPHEFANVCVKKHLRAGLTLEMLLAHLRRYDAFGIRIEPVSTPEVVAVAIRYGISSYDAAYLWLALVKELPLLTLDKKLGNAYQRALKEIA